ncbi:hypothetical protein MOXK23_23020 (plasmid) [Moraxella sp. K23]|jgi:hypothetical protein|nr:hypothetical protein [Salmonella enterica subsp. enterica]
MRRTIKRWLCVSRFLVAIQIDAYICPTTGHLKVKFDNNFILDMRIHTASSRFIPGRALSLKFDSRVDMDNAPVSQRIITY